MNAKALLFLWEKGLWQHPVDRALTILSVMLPEMPFDRLAKLSKGQRDARLFDVRQQLFGSNCQAKMRCDACGEELEMAFDLKEMLPEQPTGELADHYSMKAGEYQIRFRLLDSHDLAAIANCFDAGAARKLLIRRTIVSGQRKNKTIPVSRVPKSVIRALSQRMADLDPCAELKIDLTCAHCRHGRQIDFDILSFLWQEIAMAAQALLFDIHRLARVYGWPEHEILALSDVRRRFYLEMIDS